MIKRSVCFTVSLMIAVIILPIQAFAFSPVTVEFDNYLEFLSYASQQTQTLPEDFVIYSEVDEIGRFSSFRSTKYIQEQYTYWFKDENGIGISLIITHGYSDESDLMTYTTVPMSNSVTDLRSINKETITEEDGKLFRLEKDGIYYYYAKKDGKLWRISWNNGDVMYAIETPYIEDYSLSDYPVNKKNTFTKRLLNIETSKEALIGLTESINKKNTPIWLLLLIEILKIVAVIAVVAMVIIFAVRKLIPTICKRRKRATPPEAKE